MHVLSQKAFSGQIKFSTVQILLHCCNLGRVYRYHINCNLLAFQQIDAAVVQ